MTNPRFAPFFAFFCCLFSFASLDAQTIEIGPRAAANVSSLYGSDPSSGGWKFGFDGGVKITYQIKNKLHLGTELLYSYKVTPHAESFFDSVTVYYKDTLVSIFETTEKVELKRIGYYEIPIYLQYFLNTEDKKIRPFVYGGVTLRLKQKVFGTSYIHTDYYYPKIYSDSSSSSELNNYITTFDLGINAGAGVKFQVTKRMSIDLDARYTVGVMNMNLGGSYPFRNMGISLLTGVMFKLGSLD